MNFSAVKKPLIKDSKRVRRNDWAPHVSIGLDKNNGYVHVFHDKQSMGMWHPHKNDIEATDWEVTP